MLDHPTLKQVQKRQKKQSSYLNNAWAVLDHTWHVCGPSYHSPNATYSERIAPRVQMLFPKDLAKLPRENRQNGEKLQNVKTLETHREPWKL